MAVTKAAAIAVKMTVTVMGAKAVVASAKVGVQQQASS